MKGKKRRRHTHYSGPAGVPVEELAKQLAPPEERDPKAAAGTKNNGGAIIVDAGGMSLPEGFGAKRKSTTLFEDRVVLVIVALVLTFAAFIAWRVSQMRDEPTPVQIVQPEASKQ